MTQRDRARGQYVAGALDQAAGPSAAYLVAIVPGAFGALWLMRRPRPSLQVIEVGVDPTY
ncbi:MAG: hypothetical protein WCD11_33745 [Solirubrobacteraceae bacterium]